MREFTTAAKESSRKQEGTEEYEFKVDGRTVKAYKPEPAQLAVTLARIGRHTTEQSKVAGIIDFFVGIMDEDSATYFTDRLLDRTDPFEIEDIQNILEYLVEEWSGNPTQSPSDSTGSPQNTGSTSTPPTPALT
jgi:hypothetical protein